MNSLGYSIVQVRTLCFELVGPSQQISTIPPQDVYNSHGFSLLFFISLFVASYLMREIF
jgi:hypothetical protein